MKHLHLQILKNTNLITKLNSLHILLTIHLS